MPIVKEILQDKLGHFIPKWSSKIIAAENEFGVGHNSEKKSWIMGQTKDKLDYGDVNSCLVGEAHYFKKTNYQSEMGEDKNCVICNDLCGNPASQAIDSKKDLFNFKKRLYNHLKTEHPKLHKKWESRKA